MKKISLFLVSSLLCSVLAACNSPITTNTDNSSLTKTQDNKSFKADELIFNGKVFKSGSELNNDVIDSFFPEFIKGRKWSYKSTTKFGEDNNSELTKMLKPYLEKLSSIDQDIEVIESNNDSITIKTSSPQLKDLTGKDSEETKISKKEFEEIKNKLYTFTPEGTAKSAQMNQQTNESSKIEIKYKFLGNEEVKIADKTFVASKISFSMNNKYIEGTGESLFVKGIGTYKSNAKNKLKISQIEINMDSETQLVNFIEAK